MAEHDIEKIVESGGDVFNFRDPTKQPVADRVTSWSSTTSDTKYPSEKLVKTSIDSSVLYANQKWGGAFRNSLSPIDVFGMMGHNVFLGAFASCIKVEYSIDGGTTWLDYGLTDTQKMTLFSQFNTSAIAYCGKNTHIQPGYTGTIAGTKDLTNEIIANQRLRITISSRPFANEGTTSRTGEFAIITRIRRLGILMSTQSASAGTHCVVSTRTTANFEAGTDTWATHGDFAILGDSGWNSIPCDNGTTENGFTFGGYGTGGSAQYNEIRFEIWSTQLNANPAASQTGNLAIYAICGLADKINSTNSKFREFMRFGYNCTSVDLANGYPVFGNGIKFTARKLKTNLARTADSTFDGSADQTNIPVTGMLPIANGGTGRTSVTAGSYVVGAGTSALVEKTPKDVGSDVLSSLDTDNGNVVDDDYIVGSYHVNASTISNETFVRRTAIKLWNYIKSKLSGSDVNIGGNASTATKATQDSDGSAINTTYKKLAESSKFTEPQWIDHPNSSSYNDLRIGTSNKLISIGISGHGNFLLKELTGRTNSPNSEKSIIYTSGGGTEYSFNGKASTAGTADALADDSGYVHKSGNESIGGTKKFTAQEVLSESTTGSWNGFLAKRTNTSTNKTYKVSLESNTNGDRGIYDYDEGDHGGENKWLIKKDANNNISIGESSNINKVSIGGVTLDFSGTLGSNTNTLYFA